MAEADSALVPYLGDGDDGAIAWAAMPPGLRRRLAMAAAQDRDLPVLWSLTEAWLRTFGRAGAGVSDDTIRSYRTGVRGLLSAWRQQDLLHPNADAAALWVREMERRGLKPPTVTARVAAGRTLYAALRWCGAVRDADPFADVHVAIDRTPPWEKRAPYEEDELAALLTAATDPFDRALLLLGAHAGLRAQECIDLRWGDLDLPRKRLVVRQGKGGKRRTVTLGATLQAALREIAGARAEPVLPYRTPLTAWRRLRRLCAAAGVSPKGVHALRHSAGTRLYAETNDLETTARHLGHSTLETARVYAKWSDRRLRDTVDTW